MPISACVNAASSGHIVGGAARRMRLELLGTRKTAAPPPPHRDRAAAHPSPNRPNPSAPPPDHEGDCVVHPPVVPLPGGDPIQEKRQGPSRRGPGPGRETDAAEAAAG